MPQFDAGPGDWSDRPWEDPEKKPEPHARRSRRFSLPPWALLVIIVGIFIILCVSLVLIVRAIRGGGEEEAIPTVEASPTAVIIPTATQAAVPEPVESPTPTAEIPIEGTVPPTAVVGIGPGATVVVQGTGGTGLNIRQQPTTYGKVVASAKEGEELEVLEGPHEADGYTWWKVKTGDGQEGWGAAGWLVLKEE